MKSVSSYKIGKPCKLGAHFMVRRKVLRWLPTEGSHDKRKRSVRFCLQCGYIDGHTEVREMKWKDERYKVIRNTRSFRLSTVEEG